MKFKKGDVGSFGGSCFIVLDGPRKKQNPLDCYYIILQGQQKFILNILDGEVVFSSLLPYDYNSWDKLATRNI